MNVILRRMTAYYLLYAKNALFPSSFIVCIENTQGREGRLFPSQKVATRGSKQNLCFEMGEHQVT